MTLIRGASPTACWIEFQRQLFDYWARLQSSGKGQVRTQSPDLKFDGTIAEVTLGGALARDHVPMATPSQVLELVGRAGNEGTLIGGPPVALVLGHERLRISSENGQYVFHTTEYKYTLAASFQDEFDRSWFAIRLESDDRPERQSWFLNHPIHHYQLGACDELRLLCPRGRSLIAFVDAALRTYAHDAWGDMYPELFLALQDTGAIFRTLKNAACIDDEASNTLQNLLRGGRAEKSAWYLELEQWRADIRDRCLAAPELFDVLITPQHNSNQSASEG